MRDISEDIYALLDSFKQFTKDEIEQAALRLESRYTKILNAPNDPLNYISDMEQAILKIKVKQARSNGDRDLFRKLKRILANSKKSVAPPRLQDGRFLINKIGFTIHVAELFNHYKNIFNLLDKDHFAIILYDEAQSLLPLLEEMQISHISIQDVKLKGFVFKYLVSNHVIGMNHTGRWIIQDIGLKNIRFMYALGKSQWNFSDWNSVYDLILCFGPYQVEKLNFCENTKKLMIGYPRYDEFFTGNVEKGYWLNKFNCDPSKKTIVWMPTKGELSSIKTFSRIVAKLMDQYNVIVKPHPLSLTEDVQEIDILKHQNFNAMIDEFVDNTYLFYIADYIFSDYGGTAFGAIYTDCNLILLNLPNPENDQLTGMNSADIALRQSIININPENGEELPSILYDQKIWKAQKQIRSKLRDVYFAPYYGNAAEVTADIFRNLDQILED